MKKIYFFIFPLLIACTKKNTVPDAFYLNHTINLFADDKKETSNETSELSFKQILDLSNYAVYTNNFVLIDSFANDRGVKDIYLYEIINGKLIKPKNKKRPTRRSKKTDEVFTPTQFLSTQQIVLNKNKTDSIHIFLIQNNEFKLLKKQLKIPYSYFTSSE